MIDRISRRELLRTGAALGAASMLPASASAQGKQLVAATFPGTWNEAHRQYLAPAFTKRTGASVTQSILLGNDQLSRLTAAKGGKPPFDVALFRSAAGARCRQAGADRGISGGQVRQLQGCAAGVPGQVGPLHLDADHRHRLQSEEDQDAADQLGRAVGPAIQGPRRTDRAQQPARHRVPGRDQPAARRHEENFEPAFKALRELLPNVGAIGANLGAYATLWQQEQVDIAPYNFNFVQTLKGKDVPVELSIPTSGPVGWTTSMHVVANAAEPELAVQYIDAHLDPAVQGAMLKPPYDVIPTNSKVQLEGAITASIAKSHADLAKIRSFDWEKLNPQRGALIERFNREIKL